MLQNSIKRSNIAIKTKIGGDIIIMKKIFFGMILFLTLFAFTSSAKAQYFCENYVSGEVFVDLNMNGYRDFNEPGVAKAKVAVDGLLSRYHQTTWSWQGPDAGLFVFERLVPCGRYQLTAKKGSQSYSMEIEVGEVGDGFYSLPFLPRE